MHNKFRNIGLIFIGVIAGVLISLNFQAVADRAARTVLPIEELRAFTEVFGAIKTNYVEPVEDKKLITEAINGMLTGLDPHSAYLDQEAFKELQVGTQGQFGGLGIEVGMEDGFVKVISPIEDTPAFKAGIKPGDLIIKLDEMPVKGMTLTDAVKKGGAMASSSVGGMSGAFIPVSEDAGMIEAARAGALSLEKLEAWTSVCSVGIDMVAVPGSTSAETIAAIIADEMAIGVMNNKTTAVRIIPVPGREVGEMVEFGGLLGSTPIMPVSRFSSDQFIRRGGRIPAPLQSLRN